MVTALKERTHWPVALWVSVGVRMLYHLYQGILGLFSILPFGIILTCFYLRRGRLWPLIVAHVAGDYVPLILHARW